MSATNRKRQHNSLTLQLFGGPRLWREGDTVRLSPNQEALLAIAFNSETDWVPKALVLRLLWDHRNSHTIRHNLSQLIYRTNQKCGCSVVAIEGEYLRARKDIVRCDLDDFATMLRTGKIREACELVRTGLLSASRAVQSERYLRWVEIQQVANRASFRRALIVSWNKAQATHDWEAAREALAALLRVDADARLFRVGIHRETVDNDWL